MRHSQRIEAARESVRNRQVVGGQAGNLAYIGALERGLREAELEITHLQAGHVLARLELDYAIASFPARVDRPIFLAIERARYAVDNDAEYNDFADADEASAQAAFWRARALELGAREDEYRTHMDRVAST
jgi:hypothetical protein